MPHAYEIQSKSDIQAGAILIVKIPEGDVDKKSLYTIWADRPSFVLPFRHRAIDGKIEFTYQIGNNSRLAYLSSKRSPVEYVALWFGILQPLLDCWDWFMNPYSFLLKPEHLYFDKNGKTAGFVYIPSMRACSDYQSLKDMVIEVVNKNPVADISLENKVLRAIQDFNPKDFLQMLKPYGEINGKSVAPQGVHAQTPQLQPQQPQQQPTHIAQQLPQPQPLPPRPAQAADDEISINLAPAGKENGKKGKPPKANFAAKEKPPKPQAKHKEKGGFLGKRKKQALGAAEPPYVAPMQERAPMPAAFPIPAPPSGPEGEHTQIDAPKKNAPRFRYAGNGGHPALIEVGIAANEVFTIGRFDISIGSKQSDFEFEKSTKAVSRRHAAVERNAGGYYIVDMDSSGGTFYNGQKLPPNAPFELKRGTRVSFGNAGADYIWEG